MRLAHFDLRGLPSSRSRRLSPTRIRQHFQARRRRYNGRAEFTPGNPRLVGPSFMQEPSVFRTYGLRHGLLADFTDDAHPTRVTGWSDGRRLFTAGATHFGFVHRGPALLECASGRFELKPGMYFCVPGEGWVEQGAGMVVSRGGPPGLFHLGGPIEERGRLRYIDGCTDSLLIPPILQGDPCLNLLHVPAGVHQTRHTHPSIRIGLIVRGAGMCRTPEGERSLLPGEVFVIRAGGLHSFHTAESDLTIVAYHPDSDFGPTHEAHPMINRTLLAAEPAPRVDRHAKDPLP
jgi:hypothetical protein